MRTYALAALACLAATACASPKGGYPSLAVRDAERVTGTLQPAEPYIPAPPSAATVQSVSGLVAEATTAYDSFRGKVAAVRATAQKARGAAVGSDAWAAASVALAGLETERSRTMLPLAELDRITVDAATLGDSTLGIADAQARVSQMVDDETAQIGEIHAMLGN